METDMKKVKQIAKLLVWLDIEKTFVEHIVTHPFTSNPIAMVSHNGEHKFLDLTKADEAKIWREDLVKQIEKAKSLTDIILMMNKPYWLYFITTCSEYISESDLGSALGGYWQQVENISGDRNVFSDELVELFVKADKNTLMDKEELEKFNNLPDIVKLYRGVTNYNKQYQEALSWTDDKEKALWFMNRFSSPEKELWTIEAPKSAILACFSGEGEHIVDLVNYVIDITVERGDE